MENYKTPVQPCCQTLSMPYENQWKYIAKRRFSIILILLLYDNTRKRTSTKTCKKKETINTQ